MLEILKKICENKEYAAFYTDENDVAKFIYGRLLGVNENFVLIDSVHPVGSSDGILLKQTKDIIRVELHSQYSDKMKKLMSLNEQKQYEIAIDETNLMKSLLDFAKKKNKIVSIEILNSGYDDVVGFIENIQNNTCIIKQINLYGFEDGISCIAFKNITQISCDSQDEIKISKLWNFNQNITQQ